MWSVRKWYIDCVAEDGTTWIGYWCEVRLVGLSFRFASSLVCADGSCRTTPVAHGIAEPGLDNGRILWAATGVVGGLEMVPRVQGVEKQLSSSVLWRCIAPSADAIVTLEGKTIRGRGYAEVLELSAAPWRLPIDTLRWGRAVGERTSLVWIQWEGASPLSLVVRDGVFAGHCEISDTRVVTGDLELTIASSAVLREDRLAPSLAQLKPLSWLFPRRFTAAMEHKWRGRGTFRTAGRPSDEGWVIHERVEFSR